MPKPTWLLSLALLAGAAQAVTPLPPPTPLAAPPPQAIETASGMSYIVLTPAPDAGKLATGGFIEYRASVWTADGTTRVNGRETGAQIASMRQLIQQQPALARALMTTPVGETRRWWIQAERLKPGYAGMPDQLHVVDLTVLGAKSPVQVPEDVGAVPADALRTASGLAYRILKRGDGGPRPSRSANIEIDYTGWTSDGRMFDSSVVRGERAVMPLSNLIPGWQEGVPLMSRGDTYRFWIPGHLAYDSSPDPNMPRGMLVFDVTLYDFSD